MPHNRNLLRLNAGFLLNAPVGASRDLDFDIPHLEWDPEPVLEAFSGVVRLSRTAQGLLLQAQLHAALNAECGRCLTPTSQPLTMEFTELYAFSRNSVTDSGLLFPDDGHIDLAPLVREYALLAAPIVPLCRPDCKGLCPVCGENQNETTCNHSEDPINPDFEILNSLNQSDKPADNEPPD